MEAVTSRDECEADPSDTENAAVSEWREITKGVELQVEPYEQSGRNILIRVNVVLFDQAG
jgi:hypothetical protein